MILELLRDLVFEIAKKEIPQDVKEIAERQIENLKISAEAGKKNKAFSGIEEKVEKIGLSSPLKEILLNSAASTIYDWDDYLFAGHTGHSAVFTSLFLGENFKIEKEKVLKAVIVGNEIGGRFGIATLMGPLNGQMMTFLHGIISASITEFLMGDISKIPKKISFYVSNPHFLHFGGFMGGETKVFSVAFPTIQGVIASIFDFKENERAFDSFFKLFSYSKLEKKFLEKVFSPDFFLTRTLMIKELPGCAYVLPQLECVISLKDKIIESFGKFDIDCVQKIEIEYSIIPAILDLISSKFLDFSNHIPAQFSTYCTIALALSGDNFSFRSYENIDDEKSKILQLTSKIQIKHNPKYTEEVIERVINHFPFLLLSKPKITGLIRALLYSEAKINTLETLPIFPKVIKTLIQKPENKDASFSPDSFEFIFPAKVRILYRNAVFEEERLSHSFPAKSEKAEEIIKKKKKFVMSNYQ
ncbi:MAG: hypothetical protein RRA63_00360 [Candidatus Calescibacterium sp.]|jgi:hypothetical protein|nr:hypothetical protein [Candidatus Calescibacterium sp.]